MIIYNKDARLFAFMLEFCYAFFNVARILVNFFFKGGAKNNILIFNNSARFRDNRVGERVKRRDVFIGFYNRAFLGLKVGTVPNFYFLILTDKVKCFSFIFL